MKRATLLGLGPILFLITFNLCFFFPVLFQDKMFVTTGIINSDLLNQNYPNKDFYARKIKTGRLALWCDSYGNGFPIFAEGQTGELYPLNLLVFFLFPMPLAYSFSLALHYFLASFWTYLLTRKGYRLEKIPSLFAALSFAYGSFLIIHLVHLNLIQVLSWLPLTLLAVEMGLQSLKPWKFVMAALTLILSGQFLAGHQSGFYFSCFFLSLYTLARCLKIGKQGVKVQSQPLLVLPVAAVFCLTLCAAQLLPTLELLQMTKRGRGFSYEAATFYKMTSADLFSFPRPNLNAFKEIVVANEALGTHSPWESYLYQGFLIPFFLLLGLYLIFKNRLPQGPLIAVLIFFFLAALGRSTVVYEIAWRVVPFMKQMRYSTRFLFGFQLAASLIAGFGVELSSKLGLFKKNYRLRTITGWLLLIVLSSDLLLNQRPINSLDEAKKWLAPPESAHYLKANLDDSRFFSINANAFDPSLSLKPQAQDDLRNLLPTNYHLLFGLSNVYVNIEAFNPEKDDVLAVRSSTAAVWNAARNEIIPLIAFTRIMEAKGTKFALTDLPVISPNLENPPLELITTYPVEPPLKRIILLSQKEDLNKTYDWGTIETNKIYLYRFRNFLPPAKIFHQAILAKDDQEALDLVADGSFPLNQKVVVSGVLSPLALGPASEKEEVRVIKNTDEEKIYRVKTLSPSLLSTTDNLYPGWKVFVDGQEKPVLTTNYNFRGVYLENGGEKEVRFLFQPPSFYLGAAISLLSGGVFLLFCKKAFLETRHRKNQ